MKYQFETVDMAHPQFHPHFYHASYKMACDMRISVPKRGDCVQVLPKYAQSL